jgi:DNA repair exonuclease SbcCD nuclease subunit
VNDIVTTADWHLRNDDSYGSYDSFGVNSFLIERLRVCQNIIDIASTLEALLLIAGDMINNTIVDSITLYYSSRIIKSMNEKLIAAIILEGNHGFDGKDNKHSVIAHWKHLAADHIHIVTYPKIVRVNGVAYHCIPAINEVDKLFPSIIKDFLKSVKKKDKANVLVFHGPIISARFDSGFKAKTGVKFDYIRKAAKQYDYIVCGDFHRYQKLLSNVWYTGSPLQTSLRDKNQRKGYQIIDLDKSKVRFVDIEGFRFIETEWNYDKTICPILSKPELFQATLRNAIVIIRLQYKTKQDYRDRLNLIREKLIRNGAYAIFVDKKTKDTKKKRATIAANMSFQQMVEAYVDYKRNSLPANKRCIVEKGLLYLR